MSVTKRAELPPPTGADLVAASSPYRIGPFDVLELYEELLIGDNPAPTGHPQILKADEGFIPIDELSAEPEKLADVLAAGSRVEPLAILHDLVPGFQNGGDLVDWIHLEANNVLERREPLTSRACKAFADLAQAAQRVHRCVEPDLALSATTKRFQIEDAALTLLAHSFFLQQDIKQLARRRDTHDGSPQRLT